MLNDLVNSEKKFSKQELSYEPLADVKEVEVIDNGYRICWVDLVKAVCMFFVIMVHTKAPFAYGAFCRPFFLTYYFVIAGIFLYNPQKGIYLKRKIVNICCSLLLPYLLWSFLTFPIDSILHNNYKFIDDFVLSVIEGRKIWFLSVLIVSEIMSIVIVKITPKRLYIILPFISFVVYLLMPISMNYIWYFRTCFFACVYIFIGVLLQQKWDNFCNVLFNRRIVVFFVAPFVCYIF